MFRLLSLLIGYCLGLVQSAYLVGRLLKNVDIREHGSGNAGSTNVMRVLGKKAALLTFAIDILKSVTAFSICRLVFSENSQLAGIYACLGVILGHDFPFYLNFKGGKGVASTIGFIMVMDWRVMLMTYPFGIGGLFTRYVSFASLLFVLSIPIAMAIVNYPAEHIAMAAIISAIAVFQHRGNIQRLLAGTERKLFDNKEEGAK